MKIRVAKQRRESNDKRDEKRIRQLSKCAQSESTKTEMVKKKRTHKYYFFSVVNDTTGVRWMEAMSSISTRRIFFSLNENREEKKKNH